MITLQITEQSARKHYKNANPALKQMLEESSPKGFFSQDVTERVKSYEDACRELEKTPINEEALKTAGVSEKAIVFMKLETIIEALNEGVIMDWIDINQDKYYPLFNTSSDFAFRAVNRYVLTMFTERVSQLSFKNEKTAKYAGIQFLEYYKKLIL